MGKNNDAKGFNDQSDNLAISALATGNGTTPTPLSCEGCFNVLTPAQKMAFEATISISDICQENTSITEEGLANRLPEAGVGNTVIEGIIECIIASGLTFSTGG